MSLQQSGRLITRAFVLSNQRWLPSPPPASSAAPRAWDVCITLIVTPCQTLEPPKMGTLARVMLIYCLTIWAVSAQSTGERWLVNNIHVWLNEVQSNCDVQLVIIVSLCIQETESFIIPMWRSFVQLLSFSTGWR